MVRIASVNVNGVRAAFRKGMGEWLKKSKPDILALQEVRADRSDLVGLLGDGWVVADDPCSQKGRAGVAVASRIPHDRVQISLGPASIDTSGRWIEVLLTTESGLSFTVVSCYVHSGEVGTPKQAAKYEFLKLMDSRMKELSKAASPSVIVGDLNVGHRTLDIRNWKGNLKNSGFLPEEREYLDSWIGSEDDPLYNSGERARWVDVGRSFHGETEGPYSWWSWRGRAFDNNTGWRIDYHLANSMMAKKVKNYFIDKAATYDRRWSDHAPVVADYDL